VHLAAGADVADPVIDGKRYDIELQAIFVVTVDDFAVCL
jgi:hypothetical protein